MTAPCKRVEAPGAAAPVPLRFVSRERVCALIDCAANQLEQLARTDATFPRAIKLGTAFNSPKRWAEHEVFAWMRARLDARGAEIPRAAAHGRSLQTMRRTKLVPRRKPVAIGSAAPSTPAEPAAAPAAA